MNYQAIPKDVDWFCHHLVTDKLLTKEQCIKAIEAIEKSGQAVTLRLLKLVILQNKLCQDAPKLDVLSTLSTSEAVNGRPPQSILNPNPVPVQTPPPAAPPPPADVAPLKTRPPMPSSPTVAPTPSAPTPKPPEIKAPPEDKIAWLKGWPILNQAENMSREAARQLLDDFLHRSRENKCSDVHISAGAYPFVRRYKEVFLVPEQEILSKKAAENLNYAPLTDEQHAIFDEHHDLDYSYNIKEDDRYRTNLLLHRLGPEGSYRIIKNTITPIAQLGFKQPEVIEKLTTYGQGLILVTGATGSGKSSTLSALAEYINVHRHDHIITVEDPIEVVYQPKGCNITQRELNSHTRSFQNALRAALREDPDVIIIGEMRDLETIEMAIHSSETGHLVIGTLHTSSAADTMNRLLDVFPHGQQAQIRAMVAESLKGVICQQLLPNKNGDGVVLAYEIMLGTLAVSNLIREGKTFQIESTIQTSKNIGMITMEQSHFDLYMEGARSYEQTIPFIRTPDLKRQMQQREAQAFGGGAPTAGGMPSQPPPTVDPQQGKKRFGWF
ncbi:MAG: PilT/PilU family type 4a pilus ATPase [Victivallales bacterium]|nr:PilT/PilU family type 4a pilus ATPase [Victivallales bacterium]